MAEILPCLLVFHPRDEESSQPASYEKAPSWVRKMPFLSVCCKTNCPLRLHLYPKEHKRQH